MLGGDFIGDPERLGLDVIFPAFFLTLKAELTEEWGINPGSGKQLIEHFKLEGRKCGTKTKGGKPKTDQETMKRLIEEETSVTRSG